MSFLQSKLAQVWPTLRDLNKYLFHWNFYRIHLTYFVIVIILASVILYGSNTSFHVSYSDAIFLCTSSMTNTGLSTLDLSVLTAWQQAILFILMPMGDLTIVTVAVVHIRRHYFKKRLREFVQTNQVAKQLADDIERAHSHGNGHTQHRETNGIISKLKTKTSNPQRDIQQGEAHLNELRQRKGQRGVSDMPPKQRHLSHVKGYGGFPAPWETRYFRKFTGYPFRRFRQPPTTDGHHYLSFDPSFDQKVRLASLSITLYVTKKFTRAAFNPCPKIKCTNLVESNTEP